MSNQQKVKEFQKAFNSNIGITSALPDSSERELRIKLLKEEFEEYIDGENNNDLVEIADALGDMLYIIYGTAVSYGIPLEEIFDEIHRSNMSKLGEDGNPIFREDGKVLKSSNYSPPNIKEILDKHQ